MVVGRQGNHGQALHHARQALDLYRATGHRHGQADILNSVGWYHTQLGDHKQALTSCQQALALHQELGDRFGQAAAWDSLGDDLDHPDADQVRAKLHQLIHPTAATEPDHKTGPTPTSDICAHDLGHGRPR
jgi:tetratricopeptide (TPR) repeat protein